jgi:hypothetical protein
MAAFDPRSFFALHDFNSDNVWQGDEILRTYGLFDDSNKHVPQARKDEILRELLGVMDADSDGAVSAEEFIAFIVSGKTLPDMGTGPGHHGDYEEEYEKHHWEQYHSEDSPDEELNHPEDIEHMKKHEEMEAEEELLEEMDRTPIIEANIPAMFRRDKKQ